MTVIKCSCGKLEWRSDGMIFISRCPFQRWWHWPWRRHIITRTAA